MRLVLMFRLALLVLDKFLSKSKFKQSLAQRPIKLVVVRIHNLSNIYITNNVSKLTDFYLVYER